MVYFGSLNYLYYLLQLCVCKYYHLRLLLIMHKNFQRTRTQIRHQVNWHFIWIQAILKSDQLEFMQPSIFFCKGRVNTKMYLLFCSLHTRNWTGWQSRQTSTSHSVLQQQRFGHKTFKNRDEELLPSKVLPQGNHK